MDGRPATYPVAERLLERLVVAQFRGREQVLIGCGAAKSPRHARNVHRVVCCGFADDEWRRGDGV